MKRISTTNRAQNLFGAGKDGFRNGNLLTGVQATEFDADWCNNVQEELAAIVEAAGLAVNSASYTQVLEAIERLIDAQSGNYVLDTGVANAYVVALNPAISAYTDGMTVRVKAINKNTGPSTLNAGAGAVGLVNDVGGALVDSDVPANCVFTATYVASANKFYIIGLVNSQVMSQLTADDRYGSAMLPFTVTPASSLLTGGLGLCKIDFRNLALATGTPVKYSVTGNLSLAMTSTAGSLGATTAVATRLVWALVYGAGTPQIAVANMAGGLQIDESNLITTSAIGAGSTSATTWYSTSAIATPSQYKIIGICDAIWTTGVGWSAPTLVQPAGTLAVNSLGSSGYGRKWQSFIGSRVSGTTYYNDTGSEIDVCAAWIPGGNITGYGIIQAVVTQNGVSSTVFYNSTYHNTDVQTDFCPPFKVPAGAAYSITASGVVGTLTHWNEKR